MSPGGGLLPRHEPALDGLRALSIAMVLAYHGDVSWARGGFLGISVFFALSGFLVTTVLLRADRAGGIRPTAFWARRVRRLFPAAMAGLLLAGAFAAAAGTRDQVDDLPGHALAAAANVANWRFLADGTGYADRFEPPSPVLHYWSLSVEEQFYLAAPLAVAAAIGARRPRARLGAGAAALAGIAVAWGAWLQHRGASLERLYYGTDVRAAELLVGVAAAVALDRAGPAWLRAHGRALGAAGAAALTGLVALAVGVELGDAWLWQGGFALCAGLTVLVVAGSLGGRGPLTLLARGPLPALGRVSYGTYLYHFPVFLWLAPGRTSLDGGALLAARVAGTLALATASYHLLELPVRRGWTPRLPPRLVPATVPLAAAVVVGVVALGTAGAGSGPTVVLGDAQGAGGGPPAAPATVGPAGEDGVLDVLAITDPLGADVLAAVAAELAGDDRVRLTTGPAFDCGGPAEGPSGTVCRSWLDEWAPAVRAAAPDVVVLHLTDWTAADLDAELGVTGVDEVRDVLAAGVDLLAAGGATVWWVAPPQVGFELPEDEPFHPAMRRLLVARPDLRRLDGLPPLADGGAGYVAAASARLAEQLARDARRPGGGARLLLVGDSQIGSIGVGLRAWGEATGEATVWNVALPGCPLLLGERRVPGGRAAAPEADCEPGQAAWPGAAQRFDPDLVVVMAALDDLADLRAPGANGFAAPGEEAFDRAALARFTELVDQLGGGERPVAWLTSPCVRATAVFPGSATVRIADDPARAAALNRIAERLRAARPGVVALVDVAGRLCPDGRFLDEVDGVGVVRPDGVHLTDEASTWLAEQLGPELVALARGGTAAPAGG